MAIEISKKDYLKIVGRKIRALRDLNNVKQIELRDALGLKSSGIISQYETGHRGMSMERAFAIADFFHVPFAVLMSSENYTKEELKAISAFINIIENKSSTVARNRLQKILEILDL